MMDNKKKFIDLTHILSEDIPTWDGSKGFEISIVTDYDDCTPPNFFRINKIICGAGIGTHMDAPAHCFSGQDTIDKLSLEKLCTQFCVVDVSDKASAQYLITLDDIKSFEDRYGTIESNTFVIFRTGWGKYWSDKAKYINDHIFPSVSEEVAQLLIKRDIAGLGIDTLSADTGQNGFPVHRIILGKGKYLVENIANAELLPPKGEIMVLPINIGDATEAPIRLVAMI